MSAEEIAKQKNEMVKNGFIQAAKELILCEGVESVSARKIAQATGYSYATIYHYFSDMNALLLEVKERMVEDVAAHLVSADASPFHTVLDLQRVNRAYAQYYLDRPHVYHFFYSYRFENTPAPNYDLKFQDGWFFAYAEFVKNGLLQKEEIPTVAKMIIYAIHGLLALYFSSNGLTKEQLYQDLDNIAEYLFQARGES
jgi:AcrR family transcriptional regulator